MTRVFVALLVALTLAGCGYSSRDAEMIGQVKKVVHVTPLVCPDFVSADISLGVMRNGVGSMSTADEWVRVMNPESEKVLKAAAESGALVRVRYDVRRATVCFPDHNALFVETVK